MESTGRAFDDGESGYTGRATYQDVLDAPAHRVAEIVDGTLYTHPRPAMLHALASSALQSDLSNPFPTEGTVRCNDGKTLEGHNRQAQRSQRSHTNHHRRPTLCGANGR